MQILDEDMQMVRDFLNQWGVPEYAKGHFENLVAEHANEAARAEQLLSDFNDMSVKAADRDELEAERDRLQEELNDIENDQEAALIAVKYWLHDALVLNVPMRTMPRDILRQVEDAL